MAKKSVERNKRLSYAAAFHFNEFGIKFMIGKTLYKYIETVYDYKENSSNTALVVVYNISKEKYEVLNASGSDGEKEVKFC